MQDIPCLADAMSSEPSLVASIESENHHQQPVK